MASTPENESPGAAASGAGGKTRKSTERRRTILQKAAELFDRKGYANTSLDDVARAVGIKREALYYYYANRAEMLLAIIRPQSVGLIEGLREIVGSDAPAPEKLRRAITNHLKRFDRHCLEMTISLRDGLLETSDEVRSEMTRVWKEYETMWTRLIADGQRTGEFLASGEPKMVAFGILGMCNWLARWYNPRKPTTIDEIIDTYCSMLSRGLVAGETRSRRRAPQM